MHKHFSNVRFIFAVAAGKGGVGKSSMAVNLAFALQKDGYSVGVLDADLYGPSLGHMMPLDVPLRKDYDNEASFFPGECQGVKVFSLSHVRSSEHPMSVRAPVVNGLILQGVKEIIWGELDYLLVDFPPGTGDIQLTLLQNIPFSGAVIVTMPGKISVIDVKKAAKMFDQVGVPILGVIENMTYFVEPSSLKKHYLFGEGGGLEVAKVFGVPLLGEVPVDSDLSRAGNEGKNFIHERKDSFTASVICKIASEIKESLFALESLQGSFLKQFELIWENR